MLIAAVAGLAMRLAFSLGYWVGKPLTHDEREYLALAESISLFNGEHPGWLVSRHADPMLPQTGEGAGTARA